MATYDDILAKIQASQDKLGGDSISVSQNDFSRFTLWQRAKFAKF